MADPRLDEARAIPLADVAARLDLPMLKRAGHETVGPCPVCGGRDRFAINAARGVWNCRHCGGGDGIALVRHVLGCDLAGALDWLVGAADVKIDPAEAERRAKAHAQAQATAAARAEKERAAAIAAARAIWAEGRAIPGTPVQEYLTRRGLPGRVAGADWPALRFHPDLAYTVPAADGGWQVIHRGPAMLAGCLSPAGQLTAVHRTWLDLRQRKGKAAITHDGQDMPAKKVLGSKKGAAIRLTRVSDVPGVLVMGEGIETTLTAAAADLWAGAGYWAGIDLGNMAGRRVLRGQGMKYAGIPDLEDGNAFLPPPGVQVLIYVQDGDSDPRQTRAMLEAGLRRARARVPGLSRIAIAHAGAGRDLNDILMEGRDDDSHTDA